MAVPTVATTITSTASGDPVTITLPSYTTNDIVLLNIKPATARTWTTPGITDWTDVYNSGISFLSAYRYASGSIGSSVSVNPSGTTGGTCEIHCVVTGGADPASRAVQFDTGTQWADGVTTTVTAPSIEVAYDDSLVLLIYTTNGGETPSAPSGYTLLAQQYTFTETIRIYKLDAAASAGTLAAATINISNAGLRHSATHIVFPPDAAAAPIISSVTLSGTSQIGNTLTATVVTDQDPVDSTAYQWEKASDGSGTGAADISGETSSTLALTYADFGDLLDTAAYVRCGAIATKNALPSDEAFSAWQQVTVPSSAGLVSSPLKSPFLIA